MSIKKLEVRPLYLFTAAGVMAMQAARTAIQTVDENQDLVLYDAANQEIGRFAWSKISGFAWGEAMSLPKNSIG